MLYLYYRYLVPARALRGELPEREEGALRLFR